MDVRDFIIEAFEDFLAPSACLVFENFFKFFPSVCVTRNAVNLRDPRGERVEIPEGEKFTVLGYSGKRGNERMIILFTSRGVGCCKLLNDLV